MKHCPARLCVDNNTCLIPKHRAFLCLCNHCLLRFDATDLQSATQSQFERHHQLGCLYTRINIAVAIHALDSLEKVQVKRASLLVITIRNNRPMKSMRGLAPRTSKTSWLQSNSKQSYWWLFLVMMWLLVYMFAWVCSMWAMQGIGSASSCDISIMSFPLVYFHKLTIIWYHSVVWCCTNFTQRLLCYLEFKESTVYLNVLTYRCSLSFFIVSRIDNLHD